MLALELVPVSVLGRTVPPAVVNEGAPGAEGAVRSTVTLAPSISTGGPATPALEVMLDASRRGVTVPSEHPDTVTLIEVTEPVAGLNEKTHPVAVPVLVKSLAETELASAPSVKVRSYVRSAEFVGDVVEAVNAVTAKIWY